MSDPTFHDMVTFDQLASGGAKSRRLLHLRL
jgi:hypothetical protein